MTKPKPENPPAFARPYYCDGSDWSPGQEGATLRDVFAWQALPALIAQHGGGVANAKGVAFLAFAYADAMLAERAR